MTMTKIKNVARGPRTVQERVGKDGARTVTLNPGEEREINLVQPEEGEDAVMKGMVDGGEIVLGAAEPKELNAEQRFASDPLQVANRQAAEAAGKTPGLADPPGSNLVAEHRGRGSYSVMSGDNEAIQGLTKDDATSFNAMSDADKAKFVAGRAKA